MSKEELIDRICALDKRAKRRVLAAFSYADLRDYLQYLIDGKSRKQPALAAF